MRGRFLFLFLLFSAAAYSQCKTFKLSDSGDTLNCTDIQGLKQGKWTVHVNPLRGNPGYEEEGIFRDDKKEGLWKQFSLMGDKIAEENYRWGNKNGRCLYFTVAGLEHEESWKAPTNPTQKFDTILVQDPKKLNQFERVVIKTDGKSIRHGTWKYYNPVYGSLLNVEMYVLDVLKPPGPDDPIKKVKKISDTATINPNGAVAVPKPVSTPKFGQKTTKNKSNVQ